MSFKYNIVTYVVYLLPIPIHNNTSYILVHCCNVIVVCTMLCISQCHVITSQCFNLSITLRAVNSISNCTHDLMYI